MPIVKRNITIDCARDRIVMIDELMSCSAHILTPNTLPTLSYAHQTHLHQPHSYQTTLPLNKLPRTHSFSLYKKNLKLKPTNTIFFKIIHLSTHTIIFKIIQLLYSFILIYFILLMGSRRRSLATYATSPTEC